MAGSTDANTDEGTPEVRREKSKLAQRAYRKRHANTFSTLKEENTRLREAIQAISDAGKGRRWKPELDTALNKARELIGVPEETGSPSSSSADDVLQITEYITASLRPPAAKVDYTIWLQTDPLVRTYDNPLDISPYMGDNIATLAGRLYWACITSSVMTFRGLCLPNPPSRASICANISLNHIFNTAHLSDPVFVKAFQDMMTVYHKNKGICMDEGNKSHVQRRLRTNKDIRLGSKPESWKTAKEVEAYLHSQLVEDEIALITSVAKGSHIGWGREALGVFIRELAQNAVFIGDWPMWDTIYLSMAIGSWLKVARQLGPQENCFFRKGAETSHMADDLES